MNDFTAERPLPLATLFFILRTVTWISTLASGALVLRHGKVRRLLTHLKRMIIMKDRKPLESGPVELSDAELDQVAGGGAAAPPGPDVDVSLPFGAQTILHAFDKNIVGNDNSHNGNAANLHGPVG
jgi:hypothetical protein